jgi:hypothetical protein
MDTVRVPLQRNKLHSQIGSLLLSLALAILLQGGSSVLAQAATGSIAGDLYYPPGDSIPALDIYAFPVGNSSVAFVVHAAPGDKSYQMTGLPVGVYDVVAYTESTQVGGTTGGGYTEAVLCGSQPACTNHSLVVVTVTGGASLTNIDPWDWNAPAGSFPPKPGDTR